MNRIGCLAMTGAMASLAWTSPVDTRVWRAGLREK
jgi:hypothetical protein